MNNEIYTYKVKTIEEQLKENKGKKKGRCWCCGGKGYHERIVFGPKSPIREKCNCCDGTGIWDPKRVFREPVKRL